jgi:hypothetical protein
MLVEGKTRGDINVRTSPIVSSNLAFTSRGIVTFEGELIASALDNKQWIKLSKLNGVVVSNSYIASWVVDYKEIVVPQEPSGVPIELQLIEKFANGSTRSSVWINPTVVE